MSAQAQRNGQPRDNDSAEWLEFPDRFEISPASVWDPDYEDETTIQSKRVAVPPHRQLSAETDDESNVGKAPPRALMLDESQVLPSEASFATVKLDQQGDATAVNAYEQLTSSEVEESMVNKTSSRTRTLDVSHVLPGEVSYATVMLQTGDRSYSPLREFFAASNLDWRKLTVEALVLVSISAALAIAALKIAKPGVFSSNGTVSNSADTSRPQTEPTVIQTELPTSNSEVSAAVSNPQIQVDDHTTSAPENAAKLEEATVELEPNKSSVALNSEGSRKAASEGIKLKIPGGIPPPAVKSTTRNSVSAAESSKSGRITQQRRASLKESEVSDKAASKERVGVSNPSSQSVGARRESSPLPTNAPAGRPEGPSTSTPVTGGGQRPRTVTPKLNP